MVLHVVLQEPLEDGGVERVQPRRRDPDPDLPLAGLRVLEVTDLPGLPELVHGERLHR